MKLLAMRILGGLCGGIMVITGMTALYLGETANGRLDPVTLWLFRSVTVGWVVLYGYITFDVLRPGPPERVSFHKCQKCHYNLMATLVSNGDRCPECGAQIESWQQTEARH